MNFNIHLTFCAIAFSLFSSVAYSQTDANKIFTLKGFEIGETCTSAKDKLYAALQTRGNELFDARIDMQKVALSCPENSATTAQGEVVRWYVAFGPKTKSGDSYFQLTFNPHRKLIGMELHQFWPDPKAAPLVDLVYKQLVTKFGKPYFAVAFEPPPKTEASGPFNDAYWSSNMLNPSKTTIQIPYNSECFNNRAKVNPKECGLDVIDHLGDERQRALDSARGVLTKAILTPLEKSPMRVALLHLEIVDVALMAAVTPSDPNKGRSARETIKMLEDMKVPKF